MKRHSLAVPSAIALIATIMALNTLGAAALPVADDWQISKLAEGRDSPVPTSTPGVPTIDAGGLLQRLPSGWTSPGGGNSSAESATPQQLIPQTASQVPQALDRAHLLRQAGVRLQVAKPATLASPGISLQSPSDVACADMLWNPGLDVVEFGDGTGSIEYWSILYQQIYHDNRAGYYASPYHALVMVDEPPSDPPADTDLVLIDDVTWDYDEFAQGFYAPSNLTLVRVYFSSFHDNPDSYDSTRSYLWTLTPEGYLDDWVAYADIPETADWEDWYWDLPSGKLPDVSGRPLAATFDMLSDRIEPHEAVWLDDLQVTVCFEIGQYAVYLPVVAKQPPPPSQPTCSPREPDSLAQPGSTDVEATCGGSFSPLDEKDYYALDLKGNNRVRLGLFDLPGGTNWDALIYENSSGYPLACQIGDQGDHDRWKNCPNAAGYPSTLDPNKDYFVLVSRGPNRTGGTYGMRVEPR